MAINVIGVAGSMGVEEWARLGNRLSGAVKGSGMAASASGTRGITIAAGDRYQAGTLLESSSAVTVTASANTSGSPRLVMVCAQVNWVGTTEDTAGSIVLVEGQPGTNPIAPGLTQNPGVLWQTPLATGRLESGATAITNLVSYPINQSGGRHYASTYRTGSIDIPSSAWSDFPYNAYKASVTDYGVPVFFSSGSFYCGPSGAYLLSGQVVWQTPSVGFRSLRVIRFASNGDVLRIFYANGLDAASPVSVQGFTVMMDADPFDYFRVQLWQNSGGSLNIAGSTSEQAGIVSFADFRLVQAN